MAPRVMNLGSINIDHVYAVDHFVRPGETLAGADYRRFPGGKGSNQSIALAHAGADVRHAGRIGADGSWIEELLRARGVDTSFVETTEHPTGHAIIQVNAAGENAIVLFGGANLTFTRPDAERIVSACAPDDYLLLQNETTAVPDAIELARERGMQVVLNPAPMTTEVASYPLEMVDILIVNETEAEGLTGETDPKRALGAMRGRFPRAAVVLTLGAAGAAYARDDGTCRRAAEPVEPVDTTAAGDTFTGFFLAELIRTGKPARALDAGCRAAALCVTRPGAADSIPRAEEL